MRYLLKINYKHFKTIAICVFCVIVGCASAAPFLSYATTTQDLYDSNNQELESLRSQQDELNHDMAQLTTQINELGDKISEIDIQISDKQQTINALQIEIDALNITIDEQYAAMKLRIQYMYEHNAENVLDLLLTSRSLSELLVRTEYAAQISDYDRRMLEQLNSLCTEQSSNLAHLDAELEELTTLKHETESQTAELNQLLASVQSQYETYSANIAEAEALALEYEKRMEAERIQQQLEEIRNNAANDSSGEISYTPIDHTESDLAMLAAIIECEAGNQPYEGLLAVGSVVVNRVNNPRFANTIVGVIYAPYQFSPVASGRFAIVLARGASERCVQAAQEVLNGNININALYFHVYNSTTDVGGTVIGDHVFY